MDNKTTINTKYILLTLLAGFIYRLLISLQGIDHVDLGYSNTFYQNIFTHPEALPYSFNYYLTGLVGGTWHHLFGTTGLLGFRFLEALTVTAAVFFVYKALERYLFNTHSAVLAIVMSFLFPSVVTTFHYFTLTFFFLSLAAWCYSKSLYTRPLLWTYLTGLVLGLCFFVRTGNTALVVLILVPVVYALATKQRPLAIRLGSIMLGGMFSACIIMVCVMACLGHLSLFWEGLVEAFDYYSSGETSYSFFNMLFVYFKDYINIILQLLAIIGLGALYIQSSRMENTGGNILRIFIIVASLVLIATSKPYLSAISLYTLACAPIFYAITPKEDKLIAAFIILGTYVFPFGNNIGIASLYHWAGALLIIPAVVGVYHASHILRRGVLICSIYIAAILIWKTFSAPYGETESRWECTQQIGDNVLNTFTTAEKAENYRHIISSIQEQTKDNNLLVIGNQASELYYATETLPFLGSTLLDTYKGAEFPAQLDRQVQKYQKKPVVVILKPDYYFSDELVDVHIILDMWMTANGYDVVQDDEYLSIFKAKEL